MSTAAPLQNTAVKSQQTSPLGHGSLLLQRQCACGSPTSSLTGECAECKSKKGLQTKLTIGASNDPLEQEADRVADQVLAAPLSSTVGGASQHIQRYTGQPTERSRTAPASVDRVLSSSGKPLEPALRQDMEHRFGHDFSQVRVHSGSTAEQSARDVNANAYTVGHNVVFNEGQFAPTTHEGRRLIAHELTHVLQQSGKNMQPTIQRKEENNASLATIQGLPMYELLTRLSKLPENVLDDEESGGFVGGPRLVTAMRAVKAKMQKDIVFFLPNNKRGIEALPPDQAADILSFLSVPDEQKSQKTVNTDLEVDITIVAPSNIRLPGEQRGELRQDEAMVHSESESSPEAISEFEESLLNNRSIITGVILDPDTREIIGYRTAYADGISTLVDREGKFVVQAGISLGVESEGLGPFDYAPSPIGVAKGVGKAAAGVTGKLIVKGVLKKGVASGGKVTLGAIVKMRGVARAIAKKVLSPTAEANAFLKSVSSGVNVNRTLSKQAAEVLVKKHDRGRALMASALNKQGTIGPFESFQIFTRGHEGAYQAHHIVEQAVLKHLGHDLGKAPSVILSAGGHIPISKILAERISKGELDQMSKKELLKAYEDVYKSYPAWIAEVRRYFN